jgi:hypothetical protein
VFAASRKAAPAGTVDLLAALDRTAADPAARVRVTPGDLASLGYTSDRSHLSELIHRHGLAPERMAEPDATEQPDAD